MAEQRLEGDEVAVPAETGDDPETHRGEHRGVAERLPSMDVRQVRLDDDEASAGDRVTEGDAVVGERPGLKTTPSTLPRASCSRPMSSPSMFDWKSTIVTSTVAAWARRSAMMSSKVSWP